MRAAEDELERHGLAATDKGKSGSGHQFVEFEHAGRRATVFFATTPGTSDTSWLRQKVRRRIRECAGVGKAVPGGS